ncbi:MAG: GGDEF domain-containing protein [Lachnospiraceae bacterium]|nr:GGDEF domain-containing protein [Lachnospiraceae bacterium]
MQLDGYVIVYLEILLLSFLVAAIINSKVSRDLGSEGEINAFRWILRIYMAMMLIDSFTQLQYRGVIHPPVVLAAIGSAAYMALLSVLAAVWCFFAELLIHPQLTRRKWFRILAVIPGAAVAVMCFASIRTGWIFRYDEAGVFHRGPFFVVQNMVAYIYFLFTTVHAFYVAGHVTSVVQKRRLRKIASFIIAPTIGAILQLHFAGGFPFVGPSISIAILSMFISVQGDMVNMDSLTGLNNRKNMERYLDEMSPGISRLNPVYLFMIDADHFKQINDTYGHVEGDHALKMIASALRNSVDDCQGYIARLGGDEFVAIMEKVHIKDPEAFCRHIDENIDTVRKNNGITYPLSVSTGYVVCESSAASADELLKQADEKMYEAKRKRAVGA